MWKQPNETELLHSFEKNAKIAGILFIILGLIGVIFPIFTSLAVVAFLAWLMILAGLMAGYFTYKTDKKDWAGWLKSFVLIGVALYMLFSPLGGVATLGLLFSIYFFMDAFSSFMMSTNSYPKEGWGFWTINAILSMVMAVIFMIGWPFSSMVLVGLMVGFSLFFDGIGLLVGSKVLRKVLDDENN